MIFEERKEITSTLWRNSVEISEKLEILKI